MGSRRRWSAAALLCAGLSAIQAGGPPLVLEALPPRPAGALNPFVLTNLVSSHLVVEVDWVAGYVPSSKALGAAERLLLRHCERGKRVDVRRDDEIPRRVWEAADDRPGLERLAADHLDGDPRDWEHAELVWVLYAPDSRPWYGKPVSGMTDRITFARGDAVTTVRAVLLFTDEIRRDAMLWITPAKVERATLVHELGHVLGLVANPAHVQSNRPRHCSVARCVMHQPGWRAGFVNGLPALLAGRVPSRFGKRCAQDIASAKRMWSDRAAASPEFVNRLRAARRFEESALAERWRARASTE